MGERIPADSTYIVPFTIEDKMGNPLDLSDASLTYKMSSRKGGGSEVTSYTEGYENVVVHPEEDGEPQVGVVRVEIPPVELSAVGTVWEELRVTLSDGSSSVVVQRDMILEPTGTEPEEGTETEVTYGSLGVYGE